MSNSIKTIDDSAASSILNSKVGSCSQIPFVTHPEVSFNEISEGRIGQRKTCAFSTMPTTEECAKASLTFRFRTRYEPSSPASYCVTFEKNVVPEDWKKSINATFEYGDQSLINRPDFVSKAIYGQDATEDFVANFA